MSKRKPTKPDPDPAWTARRAEWFRETLKEIKRRNPKSAGEWAQAGLMLASENGLGADCPNAEGLIAEIPPAVLLNALLSLALFADKEEIEQRAILDADD